MWWWLWLWSETRLAVNPAKWRIAGCSVPLRARKWQGQQARLRWRLIASWISFDSPFIATVREYGRVAAAALSEQCCSGAMRSSIDQHTLDTEQEDSLMAIDQTQPGVVDVHSASGNTASDGTVYSSW